MDSKDRTYKEPYNDNWEQFRGSDKWKFVLAYGVIAWGVFTALIMSLIEILIGLTGDSIDWGLIGLYFLGFPASGILFGLWYWWYNEKKYRKMMASEEE